MNDGRLDGLRVLYLLRYYPTLTETFVYREMNELTRRGATLAVGTMGARADGALQDDLPEVPVIMPPTRPAYLPVLTGLGPVLARAPGREILAWLRRGMRDKDAIKALWLADRAVDFDRVHVHFAGEAAEWALAARRLHGVPYTLTVHAVDLFKPRPALPEVLAGAQQVFTISRYNQEMLADRHGVRARLLRCGVPPWAGPEVEADRQPLVVVAVGRWVPKKGLDLLVRAVDRLEGRVRLRLVSDAPDEFSSPHVDRLGLLPQAALRAELARAGLFALPCRRAEDGDQDGIPVVLMEALSAGLPVLTTPVSGIPELVDDEVGWLVPPEDEDGLVDALEQAAGAPEERARRGRGGPGRLRERGHTLDAQVEGLVATWLG